MVKDIEKNFYIISFSYKSLPLEEREKFIKTGYRNILKNYLEKREIRGYVALETCLRIEVYLETVEKLNTEYLKRDFRTDNINIYTGREAIKYLLKVICGLDSIIKGEDQILSQLKKAYFESLEEGRSSTLLNIIFNQSIETGKKFRSESRINEKNISLDSIAVKFIKSKLGTLEGKKIFIIGVGDLSQSILSLLHKMDKCELTMTNRSIRKSVELQKIFDGVKMVEFKEKYETVKESDVIISATSAPHLVLVKEKMGDVLLDNRKRFFLDLAVPRDIDISLKNEGNIQLYHLEDIWEEYSRNVEKRDEIIEKYFYIIEEQLDKIQKKIEKRNKYIYIEEKGE